MILNDGCKLPQAAVHTQENLTGNSGTKSKVARALRTPLAGGQVQRGSRARDMKGRGLLLSLLVAFLGVACDLAGAQTARLAGELSSFGSTLTNAAGIAVDGSQNAYVVTSTGAVYKESYNSTAGTYTEQMLFTTASTSGSDIAVDSAGANIFVGTGSGHTVAQYAGSGTTYALSNTFTGFTGNTAPAVDAAGNVYIADAGSNAVYKETLSGTTFSKATIATGFTVPSAITIDSAGTLFVVSGAATNTVYKVSGSGTAYTKTALTIGGLAGVTGIAVDASDDLYLQEANEVYETVLNGGTYTTGYFYQYSGSSLALDAQGDVYLASATQSSGTKLITGSGYLNFGSVGPGSPATMTIAFTVTGTSATALGTPTVVTQGLTGYDFTLGTNSSSSTCTGTTSVAGKSCTVVVQFSPQASGSRLGAVNLVAGGKTIAYSYLGGTGFTPVAVYQAVTYLNTISSSLSNGRGITVDPAGNIWVANSTNAEILKFPDSSSTPIRFPTTATCQPVGTAVDGEGNVFYTCNNETNMYELVGGVGPSVRIPVGYSTDDHLSVDAAGNLYPTSYSPANLFLKIASGTHAVSVLATAPAAARFVGAVTDAAGNTFAPDYNNNILYELPAGASTLTTLYSGAPLQSPHAIAEDAAGNLYVTTTTPGTSGAGTSNLLRFAAGSYTATPAAISVPGGDSLWITPDGTFYTVYSNATLAVYSRSYFTLNFPDTAVGQTSASQSVTLENDGTAPLTISPPSSSTNPSVASNFQYDPSSTCPALSSASAPFLLGAGASCTQVVEFKPVVAGTIQGNVVTTDNSANVPGSTNIITMNGTATQGTPNVTVASVSGTLGQNVTLTATVTGGGNVPTGGLTFAVGSGASVTATCSVGSASETCTATYPTSSGLAAGPNTITATLAADANYLSATGTGTLTLAPAPTTSSVTSALNPATYGKSVTLNATVSSTYGNPTPPAGSVTFSDGGTQLGTVTLNAGTASLSISTLSVGTHAITVSYGGATNFATSTSTPALNEVVNKAPATTTDAVTGSGTYGAATSPVTVSIPYVGAVAPTGQITVADKFSNSVVLQASNCTSANSTLTCTGNLPTANEPVSSVGNPLTVTQAADASYSGSTGTGSMVIAKALATTTDAAAGSGTYGAATTPVTVTIPYAGTASPTGLITVADGFSDSVTVQASTCTAASGKLTCTANLPTVNEPVNSSGNAITVSQAGDGNYTGSTGTGLVTIAKAAVTTTDAATGSGTYGAATTPVTVTIPYAGSVAPTGVITISDGFSESVTVQASSCTAAGNKLTCTANLPTSNEPVSTTGNAVSVSQAGDGNYSGSTGTGLVTIAKAAASTNDTATGAGTYGAATTPITVTVPYAGSASPTGLITVTDGFSETVTVQASSCSAAAGKLTCSANLPTAKEPVSSTGNSVTISQAADNNYNASSGTGLVTIGKAPASTADSGTGSGTYGAATTSITVTIPYGGSVAPTGTITVSDIFSNTATFAATSCTAGAGKLTCTGAFPTASEPVSSTGNALSITQAADTNYSASTGTGLVTIAKAAATSSDTASGSGTYGAATTPVTVTIPYGGAAAPTGLITLTDTFGESVTVQASNCTAAAGKLTCTGNLPTVAEPINVNGNTVNVSQAADTNYNGSTGTGLVTIAKAAATTNDTATGSGTYGAATTPVTVTIPYAGSTAPAGLITISDAFGETASVQATTCTAAAGKLTCTVTLPTAAEPVNSTGNPVNISQAADSNYSGSTGTGLVTIAKVAATSNDSAAGSGTYGAATTPVTVTIPYVGATAPSGSITVADMFGETVTVQASSCTAASGKLSCTANLPTASEPVSSTGNTVTISQAADSNYSGSTGTGLVTIAKAAATTGDSATGSGTYGVVTTPVTVTIPYTGSVAPTGLITVADGFSETVTIQASSCTAAAGKLTCTANLPTAKEPVSSTGNSVTISQAADTNYSGSTGTGLVTIAKAAATTGDSATGAGTYGAATTPITVTIPFTGATAPTGLVTVTDGFGESVTIQASGCTTAGNKLTCAANLPTAGEPISSTGNSLSITQSADGNYGGSTGTGLVTIGKAAATAGDSAAGSGTYGAATTTVTVTIPYAGAVAPTGVITVTDTYSDSTTIQASACTAAGNKLTCTGNLPTANEPINATGNPVTVAQAGDGNYNGSTGTGSIVIGKAAATAGDTATGSGTYGAATTPIVVTIPYVGSVAPTGQITVTDAYNESVIIVAGNCAAASGKLTCSAAMPTVNEPVNASGNVVSIAQAADSNYAGSTGTGAIAIAKAAATSGDAATGSGTYGAATTPVTVTIPFSGTNTPAGAITIADGFGNSLTVAASTCTASANKLSCIANLPTATEPVSATGNSVTVTQAGDNNYSGSTGGGLVTIAKAAATANDAASGSGTYGVATTPVTVTIPYAGTAAPTGPITVADGFGETMTIQASTCTPASGKLTCTGNLPTAKEPVSATGNQVTISQAADSNYSASTGTGLVVIGKAAGTTGDSATGSGTYGAATTPVTVTIPYAASVAPTGPITVADSFNNTVTVAASSCTATAGKLTCTVSLPTATEPVSAGGNTLTISQGADPNYNGSTGSGLVTIGKAVATTSDSAAGTGTYGAATTPVTITIPYAGSVAPSGAITLSDTHGNSTTVQASSCTAASGTLTCTTNLATVNEPLGTNPVSVSQAGDANYNGSTGTGTITIGKAAASTGDTATGTGVYGVATTPVKVTVPFAGTTAPAGAITLTDTHSNTVTIPASSCTVSGGALNCTANLPTASEPVGQNLVEVSQAADADYGGSSGSGTVTISKAPATTKDTASGTGTYGSATTTVTVGIPFAGSAAPTGTITVKDSLGNTVSAAASTCSAAANTLSCTVNLPTANEPVGANAITVSQGADSNYSGSTGSGTLTIGKAAATTTDSANGNGSYGAPTTTVVVTIPYAGVTAPTGAITVADGFSNSITLAASSCVSSGGALTCTASMPTANEPLGSNAVTVTQAGDTNYSGSSGTGSITINQAGAHGGDSANGSGSYGSPTTPITIVIPFTGATAPTGAITVNDALGNSVTVAASVCIASASALVCPATLPTANEPVGSNPVSVAQAADANHASSTGSGNVNINKAGATTGDKAAATGYYGAATTPVTVTIPFAGAVAPSGAITVTDSLGSSASVAASGCSAANGQLTCVVNLGTANEPLGANQVTIAQAADANYSGSTGSGTITITTSPVSPIGGTSSTVQNVTITQGTASTLLTASLSYGGTVAPTGAVTFTVDTGASVTAKCSTGASPETCTALYPTAAFQLGTYTITATETADGNYSAGSATGTLTVAQGSVSPILDSVSDVSNILISAGTASATLTASLTYTGPIPTGGLTFNLPGGTPVAATCTAGPSPLTCTASYPTAALGSGSYLITATEAADSNYPQGAATALLTITPTATTPVSPILATGSHVSSVLVPYGTAAATLSANIVYNGPAPTGQVTFTVTGGPGVSVQGVCTSGSSPMTCTADYPTSTFGIGSYQIQVNVAADGNYPAGNAIGTLTISEVTGGTKDTVTGTGNYGAATTPVTVTVPYVGALAPTGAVTVTDALNNTVTVSGSACTAASGVLTCTANLPTANVPVGTDAATVKQAGDAVYAASTGSGSITIGKALSTNGDGATASGVYGATTTPVNVSIPYAGTVAPGGVITVADSFGNTVAVQASSCAGSTGVLSCVVTLPTATEPLGSNPLTVSQAGDANYSGSTGSGTVTIKKAGATGGDTASGTGFYGAPTTPVTVSIPYVGAVAPTGIVTVTDSFSNTVSVPAASCSASSGVLSCSLTMPTANEPVGSNPVSVGQAGDANYSGSTGKGTITINKAAATTNDTASGSGTYGSAVTSITVTIPYAGSASPAGAVTIADGHGNTVTVAASTCTVASGALTCTANLPTANDPLGANPVTVSQAGDANYSGSTGSGSVSIKKATATTNDAVTGTGTYGAATTSVTVTIPYAGTAAPTGAVTVTDSLGETITVQASGCAAASGVLTCTANLPTASEPTGANPVTVAQGGDANYSGSTGTGTVTINKAGAGSDNVTGTGKYGDATTPISVTIPYVGSLAPTGVIGVADSFGNTISVQASSCTATSGVLTCTTNLPTANEPVGANPATVSQAADANHSASTGTGSITINKAAATTNDTATGTGSYGAASTAVTVSIPYAGTVAPTGAVSVSDGFANTATIPGGSCTASKGTLTCILNLATGNEPVGSNPVTVTQIGDSNYTGSIGTGTVTVSKAVAGADTATGTGSYGAATTPLTVTIPYAGSVSPTGAIVLADTRGNTVTVQASTCTAAGGVLTCAATLPTANEPVGANAVTVNQAADTNHSASSGAGSVTINKAAPTTADAASGKGIYGQATTPVTVTIPYAGSVAPAGAITLADSLGETVTVQAAGCTTASAGLLTCTANLPTVNEPVGSNAVTVAQAGDANYSGSTGTGIVTISKATAGSDTATGTGVYGAPTTIVTVTIPYAGAAPTGAITLADTHDNTVTVTSCTAASGTLTCTANLPTANEPVGANPVTVNQAADANHGASTGTGTVTIYKAPATSNDVVTGTGTYGAATTAVTVTIPYSGAAAPAGAITVTDTLGNTVTVPASSCTAAAGKLTCVANLPTPNAALGTDQVTVVQAPDANYSGSTGGGSLTINKAGASTGDSVTGNGSYGAAATPVTVTVPYVGSTAPSGTITLSDSYGNTATVPAASCTAAKGTLSCAASLPTANEPVGNNTISVSQASDAIFAGSTGTGIVSIGKAPATSSDAITGGGSYGAATAAITVSIPYAGAVAPTGAITVTDSLGNTVTVQASSCTASKGSLTCPANLPTANEPVGTNVLTVSQAADANYSGSTGTGSVAIAKTSPTMSAPTVSPLNAAFGTSVTLTQSVPAGETGTVTFYSGATALGTGTITNGVATLTTSALPQGVDVITTKTSGDSNYNAATSPAVTDNVAGGVAQIGLTSSQNNSTFGSPVTFTATLSTSSTSTIAGTVTFYDGTAALGTATVTNGSATVSTSALTVGTHPITATFTPATGSPFATVTSSALSQAVVAATSTIALTSSSNPAIVGAPVTFSATVPTTSAGVVPTGSVTFYDGTVVLGTTTLNGSGVANFATSTLSGGVHNVTAAYAGDNVYAASASNAIAQGISDYGVGNTTPTLTVDPGSPAAFNITVTSTPGVTFSAPVVLTVAGLPANFTADFAPGTVTPGASGQSSTMTVQTLTKVVAQLEHKQHVKSYEAAVLWACLIPLLGLRRVRRRMPKVMLMALLCLASFGAIAPLTGCGGGYFGPAPTSYTLTVTGTSGTLQRSTTVTLNVR